MAFFCPLSSAVVSGDFRLVAQLLLGGADNENKQLRDDYTPLHLVTSYGRIDVFNLLMAHGAYVVARTYLGGTPIHVASANLTRHKIAIVRALLRHGAGIQAKDVHGATPLHAAIGISSAQGTKLLLDNEASISDRHFYWCNALHWAIMIHGHGSGDENPRSHLLAANRRKAHSSKKVLQTLLAHGTDCHSKIANLNAMTDDGETLIEVAEDEETKEELRAALTRAEAQRHHT